MVDTIASSGPFAQLVERELLPQCRPEVWRGLFSKNAFTGDAYVGIDRRQQQQASPPAGSSSSSSCLTGSSSSSSGCLDNSKDGEKSPLSAVAAELAHQYPELEMIDPVLPHLCALASALESGLISRDEWARGFTRLFTLTLYHPVGTCKMGVGDSGVSTAQSALLRARSVSWAGSKRSLITQQQQRRAANNNSLGGELQEQRLASNKPPKTDKQANDEPRPDRQVAAERQAGGDRLPAAWSSTAVVDGSLRLCGGLCVQNVRVVDASVLPHLPSGNTHVPAILVAHVAAQAIAEEWRGGAP